MKTNSRSVAVLLTLLCLLFASCGTRKRLAHSESRVIKLQSDSINANSQLNDCNEKVKNLLLSKSDLQNEYDMIQNDLKDLTSESKMTIANQAKRLKVLSDIVQSQKDVMSKLKNSIADALMNYKEDELSVYTKDGNVYIALQEKLLFKSGSAVVDVKGNEALKSLAVVLNQTNGINVMIEGHTDNVPIRTKLYKDNWDLSTARATTILRLLTKDYGFDPLRITASGRGEFHPVASNDTDSGRASNRRTEIIISPDLNEIFKLLYQ
jgi:chemotaxis protein MotB